MAPSASLKRPRLFVVRSAFFAACSGAFLFASSLPAAEPVFRQRDVFVSGADGYFAYRIPALEVAPDGTVLAFAEARKYHLGDPGYDGQDIDLVLKRSSDAGETWSPMAVIEDPGERWSAANPATLVDAAGRVWVFYLRGKPERNTETARPGTDDIRILARTSSDAGATWSEPIDLTEATRDFADPKWRTSVVGPGGAIRGRDGRLGIPVWMFEPFRAFAAWSEDGGKTWRRGAFVPEVAGDECQLVELADGRWLLDIRQTSGPQRWKAVSKDGGRTWEKPVPGESVTPVACAIERWTLKSAGADRDRILWTGPKGPGRKHLVVRASYDEGATFPLERTIDEGLAAYSDMAVLRDGTVAVFWERGTTKGYESLTFTRFDREWLEGSGPPAVGRPYKVISRGEAAGKYQAFVDVCRLKGGDLLCVFYAGYDHISLPRPDFPRGGRICSVRSSDEGRTWTAPRVLFDGPEDDRDPHVAQMSDGTALVSFFTYRPEGGSVRCDTCLVSSRDGGETWDAEARVVAPGWPSSAPVRELPDGTWILGVYREEGPAAYGGVIRSSDRGKTWSEPVPIGKDSGVRLDAETDVVLLADGTLYAALRGDRVNMHCATSRDGGLTWSEVRDIGFPGHCPHFTRLRTGEILLTHRLPGTALHVSRDEAKTWEGPISIDETIGAYASTVELKDGTVLVVYYEEGEGSAVRARLFRVAPEGVEFLPWR